MQAVTSTDCNSECFHGAEVGQTSAADLGPRKHRPTEQFRVTAHQGAKRKNRDDRSAAPVSVHVSSATWRIVRAIHVAFDAEVGASTPTRDVRFRPAVDVPAAPKLSSVSYGGVFHRRTLADCVLALRKGQVHMSVAVNSDI